jgi:hypothetical protein
MLTGFFRVVIFCGGVWSVIVVAISLLGEPFLFLPINQEAALFPPVHRYEALRLTFFSLLAFFSFHHLLVPEKKFSGGQVLALGLGVLMLVAMLKVFIAGEFKNELWVLLTIAFFAFAFVYNSRTKIKKIWRR